MCVHKLKQINDIRVCTQCGLTIPLGGRPFFDKKLVAYYARRKEGKGHG